MLGTRYENHSPTLPWLADVGGRVGIAWNNLLPYAKGGAAWRQHNSTATEFTAGNAFVEATVVNQTDSGWFAGGGLEAKLSDSLSAFIEYDYYYYFPSTVVSTVTATTAGADPVGTVTHSANTFNLDVLKIGLNYRFNWAPASNCCATK